ncbi:MAG: hypothetical protein AAF413_01170 [Patescibacteria group bacterium]
MADNEENINESSLEDAPQEEPEVQAQTVKPSFGDRMRARMSGVNIYLIIFVIILIIAIVIIFVFWRINSNSTPENATTLEFESLSQEALDDLRNKDASIGDAKQTLTVASNSIFNGRVLVRDSLDVAGTINVGGALSLPGITVSGNSTFDQVEVSNNLTIGGDASIQGVLNVLQTLNVTGGASFGGPISAPSLNIDNLVLSRDLQLNRHIDAGGGTPGSARGSAIGSAGTVSVSGSDTAGTATINTGSGAAAGAMITVTFASSFSQTPHIVVSPVGSSASSIDYYVTRTANSFTIYSSSNLSSGTTYSFDWIAID